MEIANTALTAETAAQLSEIYRALWRQLSETHSDASGVETPIAGPAELADRVRQLLKTVDAETASVLSADYQKTQDFCAASGDGRVEKAAFESYLHESSMKFARSAGKQQS